MSDHDADAQPVHQAETVNFAVFSAANTAAIHLLDIVRSELSPPALELHGDTIGYQLSLPLLLGKKELQDPWRIGAGPPKEIIEKELDHVKPDILLCPPGSSVSATRARRFIKDIHASLFIHPESRVLMLKTTSTITTRCITYEHGDMDHQDLELIPPKMQTCVMRRSQNFLRLGDYRFVLEFVSQDQDKTRIKQQSSGYPGLHPSLVLNSAQMAHCKTSFNIWLHSKILNTSVTSGVNIYTGEPVAVKQLHNKTALLPYTSSRLQVARQYDKNPDKGVLGIIDVWCEHNTSPPCSSDRHNEVDDDSCQRTFYSMPLAKNNFRDMSWARIEFEKRLSLFYQTLSGLAELHQQNIIDGNIQPESLLIFTEPEPIIESKSQHTRAVISLNMRKRKKKPDASVCVAPEIWESGNNGNDLDETKIDIWALAASWLFAFTVPPKNMKIIQRSYGSLKITLDTQFKKGHINESLAELLRQMLSWEPQVRPSATEALEHEVWQPIKDQMQEEEDSRKRKRVEMMRDSDGGDKRVRVLSPDPNQH